MLSCPHLTAFYALSPHSLCPFWSFLYIFHFISFSSSLEFNVKICEVKKKVKLSSYSNWIPLCFIFQSSGKWNLSILFRFLSPCNCWSIKQLILLEFVFHLLRCLKLFIISSLDWEIKLCKDLYISLIEAELTEL